MYRKNLYYLIVFAMVFAMTGNAVAQPTGKILFEWFDGTTGGNLDQAVDGRNRNYPDNPSEVDWLDALQGPTSRGDNYMTHIRGYIYPPQTGAYTFWISSDDHSRLWLSTDDDPANKALIAEVNGWTNAVEWDKFPEQKSNPINLVAGQKYYIEVLHREGGGGDNVAAGWGGPGIGAGPVVIDGQYLSPFLRPIDLIAINPVPADGGINAATWVSLSWDAGMTAVSHNIYFSDVLADVEAGTGDAFRGNQAANTLIAGFFGFAYPDGLVLGTTYYWRVDEVEADGTVHTGNIWSFLVPPTNAYAPIPIDGGQYVLTEPTLTWQAGLDAKIHSVVFGDNFDDVNNAAAGAPVGGTSFTPPALEKGKTYYWRVDEMNPPTAIKGDVWSFTTLPEVPVTDPNLIGWWKFDEGQGAVAVDWSGHDRHGMLEGDPLWVNGIDGGALEFDGIDDYVGTGESILSNLGKFTIAFWVAGDPSAANRTGLVGQNDCVEYGFNSSNSIQIWTPGGGSLSVTWPFSDLDWHHIVAIGDGTALVIYIDGVEAGSGGSATDSYGTSTFPVNIGGGGVYDSSGNWFTGQIDDVRIYNKALTPDEIALVMRGDLSRAWNPSPEDGSISDVVQASTLTWSPGDKVSQHAVYFGMDRDAVDSADTADTTGIFKGLQAATSYTSEGITMDSGPFYWRIDEHNTDGSITKGNLWTFTVADYILIDDFESYNDIDNLVYTAWVDGFDNPNVNGSTMGYVTGASMETVNVHGDAQSVPFQYNNTTAGVSEVTRTFTPAQDWTAHGIVTLSLWFAGAGTNVPGQLYVKINGVQVNYDGDMNNLKRAPWQPWNIDLTTVGTNLSSVRNLAIGVQGPGATGTLLLDDIRLYAKAGELATPVQPGTTGLVAQFNFEGNVNDSIGGHNGTANGGPLYAPGKFGQAIALDGIDDYVAVGSVGISGVQPRTIAGWAKANILGTPAWVDVFGFTGPSGNNGHFDIELVGNSSSGGATLGWYGLHIYGWQVDIMPIDLEWHHLGASYDGTTTKWYGDGLLVGSDDARVLNTPDNVNVGKRDDNTNFFPGQVDDFRIYNRALSDEEMAGLAGMTQPYDKPL